MARKWNTKRERSQTKRRGTRAIQRRHRAGYSERFYAVHSRRADQLVTGQLIDDQQATEGTNR